MNPEFCGQQCGKDYKDNNPDKCYQNETCNIPLGGGTPYYIPDEHDEWDRFVEDRIDVLNLIYKGDSKCDDWFWYPILSPEEETINIQTKEKEDKSVSENTVKNRDNRP